MLVGCSSKGWPPRLRPFMVMDLRGMRWKGISSARVDSVPCSRIGVRFAVISVSNMNIDALQFLWLFGFDVLPAEGPLCEDEFSYSTVRGS